MSVPSITETNQYLTFKLADEVFALDIDKVFSADEIALTRDMGMEMAC